MTWLELVQKLREKCTGSSVGTSSVANQSGESLFFVNLLVEAWLELQLRSEDWKWMREEFSFQTAVGKRFYLATAAVGETGVDDLARWHRDTLRIYKTATGRSDEQYLPFWDYERWRDIFDFGEQATRQGRPQIHSQRARDKALLLAEVPDDIYTVTGEYQRVPSAIGGDNDSPDMPSQFHMLLVYMGMKSYATQEAAPEIWDEGDRETKTYLGLLERDQLPELELPEPLA
jgi:hypothetical protein